MLIIIGFLFSIFISVLVSLPMGMSGLAFIDMPSALLTLGFLFFFLFNFKKREHHKQVYQV